MQFLTRLLDYGMDIQEAQDCARFFPDPLPMLSRWKSQSAKIYDALRARGHNIQPARANCGSQAPISTGKLACHMRGQTRAKTVAPGLLAPGHFFNVYIMWI